MKVVKSPSEELSFTNCGIVSDKDFDIKEIKHLEVFVKPTPRYVFTIKSSSSISPGTIGFGAIQRKWAVLCLGQEVVVRPYEFNPSKDYLSNITLEIDFLNKNNTTTEPYNTEKMAAEFSMQFMNQAFTVGQELVFSFLDKKFRCLIKELEAINIQSEEIHKTVEVQIGMSMPNTTICFEKMENSSVNLIGKFRGKQVPQSIFQSNWNFKEMGVGGMGNQMSNILRRAFFSRVLPADVFNELGKKHCKGILLHGPPGTGKTLIARQIAKMMNAREPKFVDGPEILNKYVGESEANVRKLFAEAEEEQKRMGPNSALHIIILDEIDGICKSRASEAGSSNVHNTVLNQLLIKMDGSNQLNNILIIGMTNRRDLIDEAMLRPSRFDIQLEIGLPDEAGRLDILRIHTATLRQNKRLDEDVSLEELAVTTKNFTGAELEGLVYAAISHAAEKLIKVDSVIEVDHEAAKYMKVSMADFKKALVCDVQAAFGASDEDIMRLIDRGIINWGEPVQHVLQEGGKTLNQLKLGEQTCLLAVVFEGPAGCGKTALAAHFAMKSEFPFIKIASLSNMAGYNEHAKVQAINKMFNDSYKSQLSCIIIDDLEGFIEYSPRGDRYSNVVCQALRINMKTTPPKGNRLLIVATTRCKDAMEELGLLEFSEVIHVSNLTDQTDLINVLKELNLFDSSDLEIMAKMIQNKKLNISIKRLLSIVDKVKLGIKDCHMEKLISLLEKEGYLVLDPEANGTSDENLVELYNQRFINWGEPVHQVLQEGSEIIQQLKLVERTSLLSVLFEGPAGCGKTALAVRIAMESEFPFIRIASDSNMIDYNEHEKVRAINEMFNDSCKSRISCIIIDDLEGFIEYDPIGPKYSHVVCRALKTIFKTAPPKGNRRLIMATTRCKDAMEELGLLEFFEVIHVSNLTNQKYLINVLKELNLFDSSDLEIMAKMIQNKKLNISIKRLLSLVDKVKLARKDFRTEKLISLLEKNGYLVLDPEYNCGRKKESFVWKHFIYDESTDKSTCTVSDCNVALRGKNATNMKTHLNSKHKDIAARLHALEKETKDKKKSTKQLLKALAVPSTSSQPDLNSFKNSEEKKKKWDIDAPQAILRDQLWTKIFMSTGISTQFLKNKDVREYRRTTDVKYALPCMFISTYHLL